MGDDFVELLEPGLGIGSHRRDQGIEGQRRDVPADRVDLDMAELRSDEEVSVVSLPVENEEGLVMLDQGLQKEVVPLVVGIRPAVG
jgi:hypothetical protein